jgi:hypothetical protein
MYGARHAQRHRTDPDRLNLGIHRVCSDARTGPKAAHCGRRNCILDGLNATVAVIDTAKSTDQFMAPLGRSRDKRDLGAFDVPRLCAPAREGQVLLEKRLETLALTLSLA